MYNVKVVDIITGQVLLEANAISEDLVKAIIGTYTIDVNIEIYRLDWKGEKV